MLLPGLNPLPIFMIALQRSSPPGSIEVQNQLLMNPSDPRHLHLHLPELPLPIRNTDHLSTPELGSSMRLLLLSNSSYNPGNPFEDEALVPEAANPKT
jgi:hypothetical protein